MSKTRVSDSPVFTRIAQTAAHRFSWWILGKIPKWKNFNRMHLCPPASLSWPVPSLLNQPSINRNVFLWSGPRRHSGAAKCVYQVITLDLQLIWGQLGHINLLSFYYLRQHLWCKPSVWYYGDQTVIQAVYVPLKQVHVHWEQCVAEEMDTDWFVFLLRACWDRLHVSKWDKYLLSWGLDHHLVGGGWIHVPENSTESSSACRPESLVLAGAPGVYQRSVKHLQTHCGDSLWRSGINLNYCLFTASVAEQTSEDEMSAHRAAAQTLWGRYRCFNMWTCERELPTD